MHTFWLVLTYDLLEDRCIDDIIIKTFFQTSSVIYNWTDAWQLGIYFVKQRHGNKESIYSFLLFNNNM